MQDVLIVVDMQNDFCTGGALPAEDTDSLILPVNRLIREYAADGRLVILSRDWHPENHCSFREQGGPWPTHCVAGTEGAEFHPDSNCRILTFWYPKRGSQGTQAYSAFENTALHLLLNKLDIRSVGICGLTTEYCVYATFEQALKLGFNTKIYLEAIRPVIRGSEAEKVALAEFSSRSGWAD